MFFSLQIAVIECLLGIIISIEQFLLIHVPQTKLSAAELKSLDVC